VQIIIIEDTLKEALLSSKRDGVGEVEVMMKELLIFVSK
jgi:hypothetical protein